MKIAHVVSTARLIGGIQTHVAALAQEQLARGDDVTVLHSAPGSEMPVDVRTLWVSQEADVLPRLRALDADIVHLHGSPLPPDVEREVQRNLRVVRSLHDFSFGCSTGQYWFRNGRSCTRAHGAGCIAGMIARGCAHRRDLRKPLANYRRIAERIEAVRESHAVVAYSSFVLEMARRNGVDRRCSHVIPYFVHRAGGDFQPPASRDVAFVGRIVASKGLDVLLQALAAAPDAWGSLLVVGDGWDRARCEKLSRDLGFAHRARFLGWLDREAVGRVLRSSAVLALPSRWPEPFGIAGLEAYAAGRAVVASRVGGIVDWHLGTPDHLVPPNDPRALGLALTRLLARPAAVAASGQAAWRHAAKFSAAAHLEALDRVYAEIRR